MLRCNTWIGRLALVTLVGCGGKAQAPDGVSSHPGPRPPPPSGRPSDGTMGSGYPVPPGAAPQGGIGGEASVDPAGSANVPPMPTAESILVHLCGSCHGPEAIANGNVQGGFDAIKDIDRLVELGLVVPLDSANSPLLQMLEDGSMPPPGVEPRPTALDIEIVAAYIDNPLFWYVQPTRPVPEAGAEDAGADGG